MVLAAGTQVRRRSLPQVVIPVPCRVDWNAMTRIDRELWDQMKALTVESLAPVLEKWMGKGEIRAIIERRDRMQGVIDKLVAAKGEAAVFVQ